MADWMYWITAVMFTIVGFGFGITANKEAIIAATIHSLIDQGYLKTRGSGNDLQIVKHDE